MDEITRYNKERWEALARHRVEFSRPLPDLDPGSARRVVDAEGVLGDVNGREFRHTLSTMGNSLIALGFVILGLWESPGGDPDAEPGTWEHFQSVAPPWLTLWAAYRPYVYRGTIR